MEEKSIDGYATQSLESPSATVAGNKENTQQPDIVIFPQSDLLLALVRNTVLG